MVLFKDLLLEMIRDYHSPLVLLLWIDVEQGLVFNSEEGCLKSNFPCSFLVIWEFLLLQKDYDLS